MQRDHHMLGGVNSKEIFPSVSYGEEGKLSISKIKKDSWKLSGQIGRKKLRSHPSERSFDLTRIKP